MSRSRGSYAALLACALTLALVATAAAGGALKTGSTGPRVAAVQKALGLKVDRLYGPATRRAVKRFQRRHGMTRDGVVGPATWALIKQVRAQQRGTRAARRKTGAGPGRGRTASRGSAVARLQRALGIGADGVFGPGTQQAVKTFQRSKGLTADGVVGPATWSALGYPNMSRVLKRKGTRGGADSGGIPFTVRRVIAAASRIAHKPYRYGGGHGSFEDSGYDCSGSISYALHGGGLLKAPLASSGFMSYGAAGKGRWITIYANPGHAYMVINGRRFDTTGRAESGSRWQWRSRDSSRYVARHPPGL